MIAVGGESEGGGGWWVEGTIISVGSEAPGYYLW